MGGIRINATTKYLTRTTTPLNHNQPYTWCTTFETTTANDKKCNLMVIDRGTFTDMDRARPFWFESPLDIEVQGNISSGSINLTIGTKWFIAMRRSSPTLLEGLVGVLGSYLVVDVTNTTDVTSRSAPTRMSMGALPEGSEGTDNCILYSPAKAWQAALTNDELWREMRSIVPVRRANLFGFWPMLPGTGNRGRDWSGNGKHFTETGTLTDAIGPGVAWELPRVFLMPGIPSGGDVTLTPSPVAAAGAVVAPTIVLASVTLAPAAAAAATSVVAPAVVQVSISLAPAAAIGSAVVAGPQLVLGSVTLAPGPIAAAAAVVDPAVLLGSIALAPAAAAAAADTIAPTAVQGSVQLGPAPAVASAATIAPSVDTGSGVVLTPSPAAAAASSIAPNVVQGAISLAPGAASSAAIAVAPIATQASVALTPAAASAGGAALAPAVQLGSIVLTPADVVSARGQVDGPLISGGQPAILIAILLSGRSRHGRTLQNAQHGRTLSNPRHGRTLIGEGG